MAERSKPFLDNSIWPTLYRLSSPVVPAGKGNALTFTVTILTSIIKLRLQITEALVLFLF